METYIRLLREHLAQLDEKGFNLDSWKLSTQLLLDRAFGTGNSFSQRIAAITTDHSSWSLRDTSGKMSAMDLCRQQGRAVVNLAIREAESEPGTRKKHGRAKSGTHALLIPALEEGLKVSQYREISEIARSDRIDEDKLQLLRDAFLNFGSEVAPSILADLVLRSGLKE